MNASLFACLLLNGTSTLFRLFVQRIVEKTNRSDMLKTIQNRPIEKRLRDKSPPVIRTVIVQRSVCLMPKQRTPGIVNRTAMIKYLYDTRHTHTYITDPNNINLHKYK